jgi:catechol 2,3-dioxygenase-like lactoylglutathione lyase family enzyme
LSRASIGQIALLVRNYDDAIAFYTGALGFKLLEDRPLPEEGSKRWVRVQPAGGGTELLLAQATGSQLDFVGQQGGGRVWLFLRTDDFWRDYRAFQAAGVTFPDGEPREEPYGTVTVFEDLYGNLWDLIEPRDGADGP